MHYAVTPDTTASVLLLQLCLLLSADLLRKVIIELGRTEGTSSIDYSYNGNEDGAPLRFGRGRSPVSSKHRRD